MAYAACIITARVGRGGRLGGATVVLDDDAPGESAAEAVGVGGKAGTQLVLLLAENV